MPRGWLCFLVCVATFVCVQADIKTCNRISSTNPNGLLSIYAFVPRPDNPDQRIYYANPNYVYGISYGAIQNVCNIVSSNGYFSLGFVRTGGRNCLVTRTIGGEVAEGLCLNDVTAPADGCAGVTIQVGRSSINPSQSGIVLTVKDASGQATYVKGLAAGGDYFTAFYIDSFGKMLYDTRSGSGASSTKQLLYDIWDQVSISGCYFRQKDYLVSNMALFFNSNKTCDYNCTKSSAATINNPTNQVFSTTYTYVVQNTITKTQTTSIENNWSVTAGVSATATFSAGGVAAKTTNSFTASISTTQYASQAKSTIATTSTSTSNTNAPTIKVLPQSLITIAQTSCIQHCIIYRTSPVIAGIVDAFRNNVTFVTRADIQQEITYHATGIQVLYSPAEPNVLV